MGQNGLLEELPAVAVRCLAVEPVREERSWSVPLREARFVRLDEVSLDGLIAGHREEDIPDPRALPPLLAEFL